MTDLAEIHASDADFCVGSWRNMVVSIYRGTVTAPRLRHVQSLQRAMVKAHPRGFAALAVVLQIGPSVQTLSPEARALAEEISREVAPHTRALAQVVVGTGFWNAAVRSVMTGVHLVSRLPYPAKTFDAVETAAPWLAGFVSGATPTEACTATEVCTTYDALTREWHARHAR